VKPDRPVEPAAPAPRPKAKVKPDPPVEPAAPAPRPKARPRKKPKVLARRGVLN